MVARQKYRRSGMGATGAVAVLVLVAILGGVVYAFWGDIAGRFAAREPEPIPEDEIAEPVELEPVPDEVVEEPAIEEPVREPRPADEVSPAKRRQAERARIQADAAFKALDFKLAARLYKTAALVLEGTQEAGRYGALSDKAVTFLRLTKKVKLNPEAEGNNVILRRDMGDIEVVLLGETPDAYIVARKNGIRGEIPREDVRSVVRVTKDTYRQRALEDINKAAREMKERSGVAYYLIAERAYKEGLAEETLKYLDEAYKLDGGDLPGRLRRYEAGQLLYRAHWMESTGRASTARMWCQKLERLYPDVTELVADARELRERIAEREAMERQSTRRPTVKIKVREKKPARGGKAGSEEADEVTGVQIDEVGSSSGRNAKTIAKINDLFKDAMDSYVAGRPGNPNSNRHLSQAAKGFDQVVKLCEQVLRSEPGNQALKNRQADASRYAYHARKMKTLGFGR